MFEALHDLTGWRGIILLEMRGKRDSLVRDMVSV
jgi:hypothetical protein